MEIELFNYKSYTHKQVQFKTGIQLLTGNSGIGKSTLLNAITWVMYGGRNSNHGQRKNTKVIINTTQGTFIRQKNPEKLTILLSPNVFVLEQVQAQDYIERVYGPKIVWLSTSYQSQNHHCYFLEASSNERYEILNYLSFHNYNPELFIEWIKQALSWCDKQYQELLTQRNLLLERLKDYTKPIKLTLTEEELAQLKQELNQLSLTLPNLELLAKEYIIAIDRLARLRENQVAIQRELANIRESNKEELTNQRLEELKQELYTARDIQQRYNRYKQLLPYIDNTVYTKLKERLDVNYIKEVYNKEVLINRYKDICTKLGIEYSPNIDKVKAVYESKYQQYLQYSSKQELRRKLDKQLQQLNDKINTLRNKLSGVTTTTFNTDYYQSVLNKEKELSCILYCPYCGQQVGLVEQRLVKLTTNLPNDLEHIRRLRQELETQRHEYMYYCTLTNELNQLLMLAENQKSLYTELTNLPNIDDDICTTWPLLQSVEYLEIELPSSELERYVEYHELVKAGIPDSPPDITAINDKINRYQYIYYRWTELTKQLENLERNIKELSNKVSINYEKEYSITRERLNILISTIEEAEYGNKASKLQRELNEIETKLTKTNQRLVALQELATIISQAQVETLEGTCKLIENYVNLLLDRLFYQPITFHLELQTKRVIIQLTYHDIEFTELNELSGGEADRISLAVLLALNLISTSPYLFIDEGFNALDIELRDNVLKLIREIVKDKVVVIISHDANTGDYDRVITL